MSQNNGACVVMLIVINADCHKEAINAECRHAECRFARCRYAECCYAECRGALRRKFGF